MPETIANAEDLETALAVLQNGTDRHQVGAIGEVVAKDPYVDPPPPKPPEPKPDDEPKPSATLRLP